MQRHEQGLRHGAAVHLLQFVAEVGNQGDFNGKLQTEQIQLTPMNPLKSIDLEAKVGKDQRFVIDV
jgi:hypothetical protein